MLDHEERFLFREEIHNLANALAEPGQLDNVEDLLAEVTTSPRFAAVLDMSERHEVDMRMAAYMVAVARVAEATTLRGLYP